MTRRRLGIAILAAGLLSTGTVTGRGIAATGSDGPGIRLDMGMAGDGTGHVVMFGGAAPNQFGGLDYFDDTWTWDGVAWSQQHPATSPSPRCCFGMAWDFASWQLILFGGTDGSRSFGDTWSWDGSTWTKLSPLTSPAPQAFIAMAYDAQAQRIVFVDEAGGSTKPTWSWDGSTWTALPADGKPQQPRFGYGMARDSTHALFFGGGFCTDSCTWWEDTRRWDGSDWHRVRSNGPAARCCMGMVGDEARGRVLLYGGEGADYYGDTWVWRHGSWTELHPPATPGPRQDMGIAYQHPGGQIVVYGGWTFLDPVYVWYDDTWVWDGVTWTCVASCGTP